MNYMTYENYRGTVEYSSEDKVLHGKLIGIDDLVTYEGQSVEELEKAFRDSVDDYIAFCEVSGKKPERTYSGRIALRIGEDLHREIAMQAESMGASINAWIADALRKQAGNSTQG